MSYINNKKSDKKNTKDHYSQHPNTTQKSHLKQLNNNNLKDNKYKQQMTTQNIKN
jgi:hypothetical protein